MSIDKKRNTISLGLVIGTILGAVLAYFYAPKKGIDTKKILANKANHLTQKTILKTQEGLIQLENILENSIKQDDAEL